MKFRSDPQRSRAVESRGQGRRIPLVVGALLAATALAACSSTGGKPAGTGGGGGAGGGVNTPRVTIAMVTHEAPGDTFWDLIRKGAQAAADKDNIELKYSANQEGPEQGNLVQNAVDSKVAGIAVTLAQPDAMKPAVRLPSPRVSRWSRSTPASTSGRSMGALEYFGQDETLAGETAASDSPPKAPRRSICVIQEQGSVALEARCAGVKAGMTRRTRWRT